MKPNIVEVSVDVKPLLVGSVDVKPSLVDYHVSKLGDNEVETTSFFSTEDRWKVRDDMINWMCWQAIKGGFTLSIKKSNLIKPGVVLACERSDEYKTPKKKG